MDQKNDQKNDQKHPLISHLLELRRVLVISLAAVLIAVVVVFGCAIDPIMKLIQEPIIARGIEMSSIKLTEPLMTKIKVSLIAGFVIASPVIIWQIWNFVKPALYPSEKRAFWGIFAAMVLLFLVGVVFCYGAVYVLTVEFFIAMGGELVEFRLSIADYVDYLFGFVVPFGVAFELPVVLYITTRMGLTNYQMLASKRKFIILGVVIVAAVLTPPDVVSQVMLAVPILILFEISLIIVRLVQKKPDQEDGK